MIIMSVKPILVTSDTCIQCFNFDTDLFLSTVEQKLIKPYKCICNITCTARPADWSELTKHGCEKQSFVTDTWLYAIQYWPKVTHGPAHFLRARSARHLQYMNGRHIRATNASWSACQMQLWRANVTQMLCECHANVVRMLRGCCTDDTPHMRDIRVANAM
jgi:hypothetical protein